MYKHVYGTLRVLYKFLGVFYIAYTTVVWYTGYTATYYYVRSKKDF